MSYLLDTNAVSEPRRPAPDPGYLAWLLDQQAENLFISVLTLGELKRGVISLPPGARRTALEAWLARSASQFSDRVLWIDEAVAGVWAELALGHKQKGLQIGLADELIAATALAHDLTVVTRNVRDFQASGCRLLSPWTSG